MKVAWLHVPPEIAALLTRTYAAHRRAHEALDPLAKKVDAMPYSMMYTRADQVRRIIGERQRIDGVDARVRATYEAHKRRANWATIERFEADVRKLEMLADDMTARYAPSNVVAIGRARADR